MSELSLWNVFSHKTQDFAIDFELCTTFSCFLRQYQGISQYFLKVLIAQYSIPHWNCIEIPIPNTFPKFWKYWNTINTQYFFDFENGLFLGNFGPKWYFHSNIWIDWIEMMILQQSFHFSDFVTVKNWILGESYDFLLEMTENFLKKVLGIGSQIWKY